MNDKQLIKHLEAVIQAQQEVIKAYELITKLQAQPPYTITSGGDSTGTSKVWIGNLGKSEGVAQ
jgi:hypothetical protein